MDPVNTNVTVHEQFPQSWSIKLPISFTRIKKMNPVPVKQPHTIIHLHQPIHMTQCSQSVLSKCSPVLRARWSNLICHFGKCISFSLCIWHFALYLCLVWMLLLSHENPSHETVSTLFWSQSEPHKVWKCTTIDCWKAMTDINNGCPNAFWKIVYLVKTVKSSSYSCAHLDFLKNVFNIIGWLWPSFMFSLICCTIFYSHMLFLNSWIVQVVFNNWCSFTLPSTYCSNPFLGFDPLFEKLFFIVCSLQRTDPSTVKPLDITGMHATLLLFLFAVFAKKNQVF